MKEESGDGETERDRDIHSNKEGGLRWTGDWSKLYPASHLMTAGIGSSSPVPLKLLKVKKMDGWMYSGM